MSSYVTRKTPGNTEWFSHDRFGMFIHFGLYSLPARHEWIKKYECITDEKYQKYFDHFNPDLFDAKEWAKAAKNAGMKYAILTTKHHEGFCLFDSKYTDYKITNTPFGRDLVREYVDAFRAEGIKVGFYYSLLDWHHEDYPMDVAHPHVDYPWAEEKDKGRDIKKYAEYMRNQVTELLTNYGKIDIIWFDYTIKKEHAPERYKPWMQHDGGKTKELWEAEELITLIRKLQPGIMINNRLDVSQDVWTPEQKRPTEWAKDENGELLVWEACHTFSGAWGYHRDEMTWKSDKMLIDLLTSTVAFGGNLIMNVGPCSRGYFDHRAESALKAYGDWMRVNSRSIYGCTMAEPEFKAPDGTVLTQSLDEKRLYVHMQSYPFASLTMENLAGKIDYVQFLSDGSEILYTENEENGTVEFTLPHVAPFGISPVIEIILK
ncbi:MAG: alpha-L-fucosidase [Oscillospiraceae bacterium]|nr:alpha-L-fucosidase [Oscillospiraceae bacterium]